MLILSYTFLCLISSAYSVPLFEYLRPKSSYIAPGLGRSNLNIFNPASHAANQCSLGPSSPEVFWYEQAVHNGVSPFIPSGEKWNVFRNAATKFGADRTGRSDAQQALQNAINDGSRNADNLGTTGKPAVIYLPQGIYSLDSPLQLSVGTVLMGDPLNPPTLKASPNFKGDTLIYAKDPHHDSTTTFFIALKNLQLDSTGVGKDTNFTLLDWSVSQATQLTNIMFNMPTFSTGHTGIAMPEGGSGTHMSDLVFKGGAVGINMSNQQYEIASSTFTGCTTGIVVTGCFSCVFIDLDFQNSAVGIDMSLQGGHSISLIDSTASYVSTVVKTQAASTGDHSLVIENFSVQAGCSDIVSADGKPILTGTVPKTWVYGNTYIPQGPDSGSHQNGTTTSNPRPATLTSNGKYIHIPAPSYQEYPIGQFLNVKTVAGLPVHGDGTHDDTANLAAIISAHANCKILFFPQGTYLVSSTLHFPPGSRVVGEAWSTISASGAYFKDATSPKPMIQVGQPGEKGVAQFSDMLFTVSDILPGCILLEVNLAGLKPGDVGFWNTHLRIGGTAGSKVQTDCHGSAGACQAAFILVHLTATSSSYIENMWAWTADHDLDGQNKQVISTGRGMLIEAMAGTWLHGTAVEHNTLYQYNFRGAQDVFVGLQQSETPYWQGAGSSTLAPAPWMPSDKYGDPDFSNCNGADAKCRMAWYNYIRGSKNVAIYGSAFWTFFNAGDGGCQAQGSYCQKNAARIEETEALVWFNVNTKGSENLVVDGQGKRVEAYFNPGSWGAAVGAYLSHA